MNEPDPIYRWDFFLAHAGADSATAGALYEALSPTTRVFLDERSMLPGDPWTRILPAVLRETRITVVLVSTHTRDAWYEDSEIRIALDLLRDYPGRYRVIALLLDEAEPIRRSALPYGLEQTVTLSWSTCGGVQQVARRLIATLRADEDKRSRHNDAATAPEVLPLTDSVTAFVGQTERGPTWPMLITSWDEFTRSYGQPLDSERTYLPVAVRGFFQNGGDRAYVARVLTSGAACAFLRIATADRLQDLVLTARNAGSYGNTILVDIGRGSRTGVRVRIRQMPNAGLERPGDSLSEPRLMAEDYDNVSPNPSGPNPLLRVINRSELVSAEWGQPGRPEAVPESGDWNLSGGADGWVSVRDYIGDASVPAHDQTALASLTRLEDIAILCVPDAVHPRFTSAEQEELTRAIVTHCERQRCFAILATAGYDNQRDLPATLRDTSAAAIYFPWVTVPGLAAGTQMRVPPVGHIAGVYVRHDRQRGVHVSPLGIELKGLLSGPTEPDFHCSTDIEAIDELVRRGFNWPQTTRRPGSNCAKSSKRFSSSSGAPAY
jgi:hypothetical protein